MKFTEETAAALQKKWGVADTTVRVWRHRGEIPDEYNDPEYSPRKPARPAEQARAIEVLSMAELNIARMWSVTNAQLRDFRKGDYRMSKKKFLSIKTEITQLRNLIRQYIAHPTEANLSPIIEDRRIKSATLFSTEKKMYERLRKGLSAYEEELESTKLIITALYNSLKM